MKVKDVVKAIATLLIFISLFALFVVCSSLEFGSLTNGQAVVKGIIWVAVAFVSLTVKSVLEMEEEN